MRPRVQRHKQNKHPPPLAAAPCLPPPTLRSFPPSPPWVENRRTPRRYVNASSAMFLFLTLASICCIVFGLVLFALGTFSGDLSSIDSVAFDNWGPHYQARIGLDRIGLGPGSKKTRPKLSRFALLSLCALPCSCVTGRFVLRAEARAFLRLPPLPNCPPTSFLRAAKPFCLVCCTGEPGHGPDAHLLVPPCPILPLGDGHHGRLQPLRRACKMVTRMTDDGRRTMIHVVMINSA